MDREQLKRDLKQLLVEECQKEFAPESIGDDAILMGPEGGLNFDSLDALQISMAVQRRYGKRIQGNNQTRSALTSINTLANFILS